MPTLTSRQIDLPIGVFDSGMGGLTVLRELKRHLPHESFVYLGDTARLPYGTKSQDTVIHYAAQMARILDEQKIKLLVVACNTATTTALPHLKQLLPHIPVIGVVEPGAQTAIQATRNNRIIVLATETTIRSGIYQKTISYLNPAVEIITQSCGLFVALAEEGCVDDDIARVAVRQYLTPIISHAEKKDCVLLGCTHFPVLMNPLRSVLGKEVSIVDSATATAKTVETELRRLELLKATPALEDKTTFLVTDLPERFIRVGKVFYGQSINPEHVHLIDGRTNAHPVVL